MVDLARRWPQGGASPRATIRYGVLGLLALAALIVGAWAQLSPDLDHQVAFLIAAPTAAGATLLAVAWLILSAPWSWGRRVTALISFMVLCGIGYGLVRVDETSGDVVPKLAWRWTPKHDLALSGSFDDLGTGTADLRTTTPEDYAEFLGPGRRATVSGPALERDWSAHPPRELWRRPIGAGWGSFAIVGNYAVTQEQRGDDELVVCYELDTGKPVWHHADSNRFEEIIAGVGPRATPTIVDGRVYTTGALGVLNCLDGETGKRLWHHDLPAEHGADTFERTPQWGISCSPLVVDDAVIVSAGGPDGHSLVAYHRETGDLLWRAGDDPASYSSPHLTSLGGARQVVIVNRESVAGHDPADGRLLWRYEWLQPNPKCAQPLVIGEDRVLVSAGYGLGSALLRIARDADGQWAAEQQWPARNLRNLKSKFADMLLIGDVVYALDDGVMACLEAATGKRLWRGGRYGHGQLLLVADLILVQAENGELALVEPNPKSFIELGGIAALNGKTWNNPAITGRKLLVRNHEQAACYELPVADLPDK